MRAFPHPHPHPGHSATIIPGETKMENARRPTPAKLMLYSVSTFLLAFAAMVFAYQSIV
jgi:hypothetical protein